MDVTLWVQWFAGCIYKAADAALAHMQTKAINKLYDVGPEVFINGISTEKYVNLCPVSRATAYRELRALCDVGVLVQTGTGRGLDTSWVMCCGASRTLTFLRTSKLSLN
jgi:hypothetical protein